MGRAFNLILLAGMIAGAIITYDMKHRAENSAEEVARLRSDIAREKAEINLLRAELSMLMQPGRIQAAVEQYPERFGLVPFSPNQIGLIEEIPLRSGAPDEEARATLARLAAGFDGDPAIGEARQ